jgi:hypothetical protein
MASHWYCCLLADGSGAGLYLTVPVEDDNGQAGANVMDISVKISNSSFTRNAALSQSS